MVALAAGLMDSWTDRSGCNSLHILHYLTCSHHLRPYGATAVCVRAAEDQKQEASLDNDSGSRSGRSGARSAQVSDGGNSDDDDDEDEDIEKADGDDEDGDDNGDPGHLHKVLAPLRRTP